MRKHALLLLVCLCLIGLVVAPATAGEYLPFKTKADVVYAPPPTEEPCGTYELSLKIDTGYEGTGTHLGRFDLFETLCVNVFEGPPPFPFEVYGTFTAANGDELNYFVDGLFIPPDTIIGGGFEFIGGTGKFASAMGTGETFFVEDSEGNTIGLYQTGQIAYDASDRSE